MASVNPARPRGAALHARVAACFLAGAAGLFALTLLLMAQAAREPGRSGPLTALFPPHWSNEQRLLAVVRAKGVVMRQSWLPGGLQVTGEGVGLALRLEAAGAVLVLPEASGLLALGGCSGSAPPVPAVGERTLPM